MGSSAERCGGHELSVVVVMSVLVVMRCLVPHISDVVMLMRQVF